MSINNLRPVLVVDDSLAMGKVIQGLLGRNGILDVDLAQSVPAALDQMRLRNYRLVICDFFLGDQTGHDLHVEMANKPAWADTPFLLLTNQPEKAAELFGQGALRTWLTKPFTAEALRERIESALADTLNIYPRLATGTHP